MVNANTVSAWPRSQPQQT